MDRVLHQRKVDAAMRGKNWRILFVAAMIGSAGVWVLRSFPPGDHGFYPKCVLHHWTGLHCPGCGSTRAIHSLVHGDIGGAIRNNPLLVLAAPVFAAGLLWQRHQRRRQIPNSPRFAWTVASVMLIYLLARNLPTPSSGWLAPPQAESKIEVLRSEVSPLVDLNAEQ